MLLLLHAGLVQKMFWGRVGGGEWALIRGWALINFLGFQGGCLFEVGAYLRWALIPRWVLIRISTVYVNK